MQLKEEQERYIERAQQEKQELQQEMAQQSRSLQQAQQQLEEVRQNRQRADEDVEVRLGWERMETGRVTKVIIRCQGLSSNPGSVLSGCVTSSKLPNLSEFQVPHLGEGTGNSIVMKTK